MATYPGVGGRAGRRPRSRLPRVLGVLAVTVATVFVGLQVLGRLVPGPGTTGSAPGGPVTLAAPTTTSAPAAPSGTPSASARHGGPRAKPKPKPNQSLTRNSLYAVDLGGARVRCGIRVRTPKPPVRNADLAPYLRSLVKCMVKVHRGPLAARGFAVSEPGIKVYKSVTSTPCGKFDQKGAPAYYCSVNGTVYWPATRDDGREAYTYARLGYVALLAHEFGHHLQAETGMLGDYARFVAVADTRKERDQLSRRLELQAQCFEGVFLRTVSGSIELSATDREQLRRWHSFTGDEDPPESRRPDHGTSRAQVRWLERGMAEADFGRCNTWTAATGSVK